ncbi:Crp/Fnr family transcriptional regulator [Bradyrhizobium sp. AZCC 2289]|uniref:Crp/Fnr family transcriptional regulator n=1 Tax=Bradyrhizobium sp. AZCC 2289 TaxID=3117026 RepID=UPI002FEF3D19
MDRLRKSSNLLKSLPEGLTSRLVENGVRGHAKADSVLFSAGEPGDGLYFIEAGLLKVVIVSPGGEESVVSLLGPGEFAGELAMIDGLPRSASVVVLRDCSYRFISKESFQKFTATHPEFYRELARVLSMRLREADQALAAATFLSGKERLARALLDLAGYVGKPSDSGSVMFTFKVSNGDLAAMAGMARENVSRVLREWRDRKLVSQSAHYHCIHDIAALEREVKLTTQK